MATKKFKANENFNINWEVFRNNLARLLNGKGFTKADLARELDLSVSTITRYFYETTPDLTALWLIADYFDVPIDWLLGRSRERWNRVEPELQTIMDRYTAATPSDKLVIRTLLEKYASE